MANQAFTVRAVWDETAKVFVSESDIIGLHIEAKSLEEFKAVLDECAIGLVIANHLTPHDIASKTVAELIPTIVWETGDRSLAVA
ncbi:MAG: DUF1902 domain-containing protein [Pseudomonadota bacterium]